MFESFHQSNFDKILQSSAILEDKGHMWTRLAPSDQLGLQEEYLIPSRITRGMFKDSKTMRKIIYIFMIYVPDSQFPPNF